MIVDGNVMFDAVFLRLAMLTQANKHTCDNGWLKKLRCEH